MEIYFIFAYNKLDLKICKYEIQVAYILENEMRFQMIIIYLVELDNSDIDAANANII